MSEDKQTHELTADDLTLAPIEVEETKIRQAHRLKADDAAFDIKMVMARVAEKFAPKSEKED